MKKGHDLDAAKQVTMWRNVSRCLVYQCFLTPSFVLFGAIAKSRNFGKLSHPSLLGRRLKTLIFISKIAIFCTFLVNSGRFYDRGATLWSASLRLSFTRVFCKVFVIYQEHSLSPTTIASQPAHQSLGCPQVFQLGSYPSQPKQSSSKSGVVSQRIHPHKGCYFLFPPSHLLLSS